MNREEAMRLLSHINAYLRLAERAESEASAWRQKAAELEARLAGQTELPLGGDKDAGSADRPAGTDPPWAHG